MSMIADFETSIIAASAVAEEAHPTIVQELTRKTIKDFMRTTRIAREELYILAQDSVQDYPLSPIDCHKIVRIEKVATLPGTCECIPIYTEDSCMDIPATDNSVYGRGRGYYTNIVGVPNTSITFSHINLQDWIYVQYSYTLVNDTCEVPDFIFDDWADTIVAGVVAQLKARIGMANAYDIEQYQAGIHRAQVTLLREYGNGRRSIKTKPFLGRRKR